MQRHRSLHSSDMHSQGEVLESELMHSSEGEGLEQGQRDLRRDILLSIGRHRHVLRLQGWLYIEEQCVCSQCVQLPRWYASCRDWHWRHTV